jgi:hypothetical protein
MKEYYNKNLGFKFYTDIVREDDGTYRFWICDSNKRICDYYSSDIILYLAEENNVDEKEMRKILIKELEEETNFERFISSFCTPFDFNKKEEIDKLLNNLEIEEDYVGLTLEEKVKKWYAEDDFTNIFGNYLVQLY